jgi:hypothetical protein
MRGRSEEHRQTLRHAQGTFLTARARREF